MAPERGNPSCFGGKKEAQASKAGANGAANGTKQTNGTKSPSQGPKRKRTFSADNDSVDQQAMEASHMLSFRDFRVKPFRVPLRARVTPATVHATVHTAVDLHIRDIANDRTEGSTHQPGKPSGYSPLAHLPIT